MINEKDIDEEMNFDEEIVDASEEDEFLPDEDVMDWEQFIDEKGHAVIPADRGGIAPAAFRDCSFLRSITISDGVEYILREAFKGCTSLTSITIPQSVIQIGYCAFSGCTSLKTVHAPQRFKEKILTDVGEENAANIVYISTDED